MNTHERLQLLEQRHLALDIAWAVAVISLTLFFGYATYADVASKHSVLEAVFFALAAMFLGGYVTLHAIQPVYYWTLFNITPTFIITTEDDVVKVHGRVADKDWNRVKAMMLAARPGMMPVTDAHGKFGCTMAAVPATVQYENIKRGLAALGYAT